MCNALLEMLLTVCLFAQIPACRQDLHHVATATARRIRHLRHHGTAQLPGAVLACQVGQGLLLAGWAWRPASPALNLRIQPQLRSRRQLSHAGEPGAPYMQLL